MMPPAQRGFTLIEVLVATVVLAMISLGLLATSWRLTDFAREEAERMVADAYCHDVTWAVYSQSYSNILYDTTFTQAKRELVGTDERRSVSWDIIKRPEDIIKETGKLKDSISSNPETLKTILKELPWTETADFFGKKNITIPLWRTLNTAKVPTCTVQVLEKPKDNPTNKVITVSVSWWHDSATRLSHSNVVTRVNVERGI